MPDFVDIPINATAEELEAVARMGTAPADDKTYGRKNGEWVEVINSVEQDYNPDSANAQSGTAVASAISTKQDVIDSNHKLSYSLLSGTPTIPTKTSDLTNDSGFITNMEVYTKPQIDGKLNQFANAIPLTVSGTNLVTCEQVSPIEHDVDIRLKSETISDFSNVRVTATGKNLLNVNRTAGTIPQAEYEASNPRNWEYDKYYEKMGTNGVYGYWTNATFDVENNSVSVTGGTGGYGIGFPVKVTPNTTYYFSSVVEDTEETDLRIGFAFYNSNGEWLSEQSPTSATINTNWQVITPANCTTVLIVFRPSSTNTITYTLNQFELGEVKTEYEEYKSEQTATANADGRVSGIHSISPTMTLTSDTDGVDISVQYHADTKKYIDTTTQNYVVDYAQQKTIVKSTIDSVVLPNAEYFLGEKSTLSITLPSTDLEVGKEIVVCFSSGATACSLIVNLTGFNFVPKANKTSWLKFTCCDATSGSEKWLVETKEG